MSLSEDESLTPEIDNVRKQGTVLTVTPVWLAIPLSPIGRGSQSFHLLPPFVAPTF